MKRTLYACLFALVLFPPEVEYEIQIQEKGIYLGGSIRAAM